MKGLFDNEMFVFLNWPLIKACDSTCDQNRSALSPCGCIWVKSETIALYFTQTCSWCQQFLKTDLVTSAEQTLRKIVFFKMCYRGILFSSWVLQEMLKCAKVLMHALSVLSALVNDSSSVRVRYLAVYEFKLNIDFKLIAFFDWNTPETWTGQAALTLV